MDDRLRTVTLNKRKKGLLKKAMELSLLTGAKIVLSIYDETENRLISYRSDDFEVIQRILANKLDFEENYTNDDY